MKNKSTMVELVDELRKLPASAEIDFMIEEALAGEYHDFKNEKYVCGKLESSQRLRALGYPELASRIEQGEFDESMDEDDILRMTNDIDEGCENPHQAEVMKNVLGLNNKKH